MATLFLFRVCDCIACCRKNIKREGAGRVGGMVGQRFSTLPYAIVRNTYVNLEERGALLRYK